MKRKLFILMGIIGAAIIIRTGSVNAQNHWSWVRNNDLLNPSGINAGGDNSPYFFDIDNDGDKDLIIGEHGKLELYYNDGFPANPHWRLDSTYFAGLEFANAVVPTIGDFDLDGQIELVVGHFPTDSLQVFRNIGTPQNPQWSEIYDFFNFSTFGYTFQKFVDWDGDGDFDLILFAPADGFRTQYWLFRNNGLPGNPQWVIDSTISASFPSEVCYNEGFDIADFNNDGQQDIIYALVICDDGSGIQLFLNEGTNDNPVYSALTQFIYLQSGYGNNLSCADLDGDGDLDFIAGGSFPPLYYYRNDGSLSVPSFTDNPERLGFPFIDGGESITLLDRNNDNDYDIAVSYYYPHYPDPNILVAFSFFENFGNGNIPNFQIQNWLPWVYAQEPGFYLSAGDITGDGQSDIAFSRGQNLYLLRNRSDSSFAINYSYFDTLNQLGGHSNPELVDLNSDNLLDLIVHDSATAGLIAFQNVGNSTSPAWAFNPQLINGLDLLSNCVRGAYLNRDSLIDLVAITGQFHLTGYINIGSPSEPVFQYDSTIFANLDDTHFIHYDLADLNGDGSEDILLDSEGVLILYENQSVLGIDDETPIPDKAFLCHAYPNPFNSQTTIEYNLPEAVRVTVDIYDILGRKITSLVNQKQEAGRHKANWNAGDYSSGIYFYKIQAGDINKTKKMVVLK